MGWTNVLAGQKSTILCVCSVVLGIIVGAILRETTTLPWSAREIMYINFPGEMFLRMLKGLILPLITTALMSSIGNLDLKTSGRIGKRAMVYYAYTVVFAITIGIVLVTSIQPGAGIVSDESSSSKGSGFKNLTPDTLMDLLRNMLPANIVQACIAQYSTVLIDPSSNGTSGRFIVFAQN